MTRTGGIWNRRLTKGHIIVRHAISTFIDQFDLPSTNSPRRRQQAQMQSFALLLAFASSAFAYLVNVPNAYEGWSSYGPQKLEWSRVDTDSPGFSVVLTNQDRSVLPTDFLIEKYVDGTRGYAKIWPPHHGFPVGDCFRVNLVRGPDDWNTIFAQSNEFTIS
ncbi:hypothetical protein CVT26_007654 [Gymnopilus dilepis]|uniref:Uncharacterized protein n=1 Tax=Gymnopilus dilepis TaxID=231916 RepID=A0A409VZJ4_9AGAR|nr:hypothetical protein CVT26_007654 [Gymnopilus dilepis]